MKVFNEVGIGLDWMVCYEVEWGDGKEERFKGWWKGKVKRVYGRIWIGRRVLIVSRNGLEVRRKGYSSLKVVLGFEMEGNLK